MSIYYEGGIEEEDKEYGVEVVLYYDCEYGQLVLDYCINELGSYYTQTQSIDFGTIYPIYYPRRTFTVSGYPQ